LTVLKKKSNFTTFLTIFDPRKDLPTEQERIFRTRADKDLPDRTEKDLPDKGRQGSSGQNREGSS
jgi:hypothetical protein